MIIGGLALAGIPILNGFWSKELVLEAGHEGGPLVGVGSSCWSGAGLTALYTLRFLSMVFFGEPRGGKHVHDAGPAMKVALVPLAFGTLTTWLLAGDFGHFLGKALPPEHEVEGTSVLLANDRHRSGHVPGARRGGAGPGGVVAARANWRQSPARCAASARWRRTVSASRRSTAASIRVTEELGRVAARDAQRGAELERPGDPRRRWSCCSASWRSEGPDPMNPTLALTWLLLLPLVAVAGDLPGRPNQRAARRDSAAPARWLSVLTLAADRGSALVRGQRRAGAAARFR